MAGIEPAIYIVSHTSHRYTIHPFSSLAEVREDAFAEHPDAQQDNEAHHERPILLKQDLEVVVSSAIDAINGRAKRGGGHLRVGRHGKT